MKTSSSLNHTFRLVWNDHTQTWVAVPETARGRGKRSGKARALLAAVLLAGVGTPALALDPGALPTGGRVVAGQATLSQQGTQLQVQQSSARAVLDWTQFNIGADAQVRFVQPDAASVALNRVRGGEASLILGKLEANGQVWLLNPGGVVFGRSAQVDVGGLVASSLAITDDDFMAGRLRLQAGAQAGAVRNEGRLTAARGGVIALVAPQVVQRGVVQAPGGSALLGAGERVTLDFAGDGLLQLSVERAALDAHIEQAGTVSAEGGLVQLSAHAASALRASVINTDGLLQASSLGERGGRIVLDGGELGTVQVAGTLDASAAAGRGGDIQVTGQHLQLRGATLQADGDTGGGRVRVGGGWQGADRALFNATTVEADAGTSASVSARTRGDGGEIVFWADDTTRFAGRVTARGGAAGGDGGRMEVSGKQVLQYSGRADARAPLGRTGDLLLDPATINIVVGTATGNISGSTVTVADLEAQNANVLLEATDNATVGNLSANGGNGRLTMAPNVSLRIEAGTDGSGSLSFTNPANTIEVSGTGSLMFVAGRTGSGQLISVGNLVASGTGTNPGSLPTHNVSVVGSGTPSAGSVTLFGADGITVSGSISTQGGYVRIWGDSDNAGGGGLTLSSPITTNGGHLHLSTGSSPIVMNSSMTLGSGRIFFRADGTWSTGSRQLGGVLSASGDVNVDTAFQMNAGASILTDGVIRLSSTVNLNTGAGSLTLRGSAIDFTGATLQNLSTASMRLEPADPTTNMVLGDASGFASAGTLASLPGIRNLTIGRADGTGAITVPSGGFSFNANGTLEVVNNTVTISGGSLVNTSGNVTITADNINIAQSVSANGGAGKVTLRQQTAGNSLNLGGGLTNASIGNISAAILAVGRADGGDLVFDNDISTTATSVHLLSGSRVLGENGGVSATHLAVTAGAGAVISDSTFDFTTLAASLGGSGTQTTNITSSAASWGLGTVDGVAGLQVQSGSAPVITLQATTALSADAAVNFANTAARLNLRAPSITSSGATVSNRSNATVSFDRIGAGAWAFGGAGDNVSAASLAAFGGTGFIEVGSATTELTAGGAVSLAVGNTFTVQGLTLTGLSGTNTLATTAGSLKVAAADGALLVDANLSAASRLVLETTGTHGITGSGTLSAGTLALRAPGGTVNLPATHQVDTLAATVRDLSLVNGRALAIGTVDGLNGVDATNTLDLRLTGASSHLTLQQAVAAGGSGVALLLATPGRFVNSAGASALSAVNGHWRVYSATPADDTRGGLAPDFKQVAATTASTVLGTGNGFLYSTAPTVTVSLTGTTSKVYDRTTAATLDASHHALAGAIDGDTLALTVGTASFDTRDVGTGKTVTASGFAVTATNGSIPVYGYALANTSASGAIGTITARPLTVAPSTVTSKVYDGTTAASLTPGSLSGDIAGDTLVVSATGSFDTLNAGTGKTVNVSLALSGADAGNYSLATSTAQPPPATSRPSRSPSVRRPWPPRSTTAPPWPA
jgi:filamentous hemagglutinin family protein